MASMLACNLNSRIKTGLRPCTLTMLAKPLASMKTRFWAKKGLFMPLMLAKIVFLKKSCLFEFIALSFLDPVP